MDKIDAILRMLYREGDITFGQSAAIFGALHMMQAEIDNQSEYGKAFQQHYGDSAVDGLRDLLT